MLNDHILFFPISVTPEIEEKFFLCVATPEDALIEKQSQEEIKKTYASLSDEAKQIINIILYAPQELSEILFTPTGKLAKGQRIQERLAKKIGRQWKDFRYAKKVIAEIKFYVSKFEEAE